MPPVYAIAVMGITGVGKSTFIERVIGKKSVKIGHGLQSETSEVSGHSVSIQGKNYMLIDTPGFDDTHLSDADVLKMIAEWLVSSYRSGTKLSAILYVHAITETRMQGTALRNIRMFKELCGEKFYENVTFGTSCWSLMEHEKAVEREEELKSHPRFWKPMLDLGSKVVRLPDSQEAARALVTQIANHEAVALRIQEEIVDEGVSFEQSSATKVFEADCDKLREEHEAQIQALKLEQARLAEEAEQRRLRAIAVLVETMIYIGIAAAADPTAATLSTLR
ncbi:P-loop containing nucleoside triphosphate hydrolase protein [Paraphoma chrysanthemicola]|uniref:P-loop containing nucleoside triphosphate hydrolase protein n=1 Tax=Paraphoma chrysanthemicola TaxID=798071 RepID=A0A8K0VVF6_9PLEO|nr:P-loop containing nucleoside triphosphate hydrolase protein [Paraphoma chrysanthemicola]